ncbi:hypothetical protein [Chelativorans sp. M5D2P16]|uniref:hypothetical protein n=1 Tax=Chelativorans sp. M5D2P16 TaxID=3095678 RepID=UPI002ACB0153|nr:hypothetical protein [Chelativorans sp. M5D2P16]MDZ5698085.1 hypothetical protein [Chelativorans sp. M5D2P16]
MKIRILTATATALLLASPAFADCQEEISSIEQAVIAAETGADAATGTVATEHQEQVLSEEEAPDDTADTGAVTTGSVEAASPHQLEVLREIPDEDRTQASEVLSEARDLAEAGDEQGCMDKLQEAKGMLGLDDE